MFRDKETGTQENYMICPEFHSQQETKPWPHFLFSPGPRFSYLCHTRILSNYWETIIALV